MGKYGLKIVNYQAGSIYEYNLGVRESYDRKEAMLTNSLFLDFLYKIGIETWKDKSTRDIICINFEYGSQSFNKFEKKMNNLIGRAKTDEEKKKYEDVLEKSRKNSHMYVRKNSEQIRDEFYINGVDIDYPVWNNRGNVVNKDTVHYKMLYRTPGKAKNGSCIFCCERLFDQALEFLRMGIELPKKNAPIVEIGAYSSLVTSTIIDRVEINPRNILIVNDVDSFFETNVVSVETDENRNCYAKRIENYKLKNVLFDGQALIDKSRFPEWADGYILLRHHFTKMAAFCADIQLFFKDYFGDDYEMAKVVDMWGNEHYAKDIEMITTDNAVKWIKFDISYDYWCDKVNENGNLFGIVKTAHKSKLGSVQSMSYQMVNSLDLDIMSGATQTSRDYIDRLKRDDDVFLDYLRDNTNFSNDYEVLVYLCENIPEFNRSKYFRDRKRAIISSYVKSFRSGKVIQNADNLVIVGSPYAMLLHSVGEDVNKDDTFFVEEGTIQCYTERFADGEYLAEFRNPFNGKGNLGYLHNMYHDKFKRYFNFGEQIIAINMIGTDFQSRNNGSDQDSDSIYTTNQKDIVAHAKYCYENYPTIENNIPKETNNYDNTLLSFSTIDNKLAAANLAIGGSSNLAQVALTYEHNYKDQKYSDYVCILSVLAQCAIDNAKRSYDIDLNKEIERIKKDLNISENKYPKFFVDVLKFNLKRRQGSKKNNDKFLDQYDKLDKRINDMLVCPMNYLYTINIESYRSPINTLPMSDFFVKYELEDTRRKSKKVEELIEKYSLDLFNFNVSQNDEDYLLLREDFDEMIEEIKSIYISNTYVGLMSWLIDRAFCITPAAKKNIDNTKSNIHKNRSNLINVLYHINKENLLKCFSRGCYKNDDN